MVKVSSISFAAMVVLLGFVIFAEVRTSVYSESLRRMRRSLETQAPFGTEPVPQDLPNDQSKSAVANKISHEELQEQENSPDVDQDLSEPAPTMDVNEELREPSPTLDVDEDLLEPTPLSGAFEPVTKPESRPDLETLPQPKTLMDLEELSESLESDLTPCNHSMQHFRMEMSSSCRKLWREDVVTRPLPQHFNYVHVPKAGTSFTTVLRNFLPQCTVKDVACPHGQVSDEELRCHGAMQVCNGHDHVNAEALGNIRQNPAAARAMVSMIRDPARRVMSAKNHDCHRHSGETTFREMEKPCEEYDYKGFAALPYIQNCQTKMMHKFFCAEDVEPSEISLSEAKQNLFNLDYFGITDEWNRSIRMFHCQFGGELRSSELMNSRPGDYGEDVLSKDTIDFINNLETLDIQLYQYALDLFNKREECMKCAADCV